MEGWINFKDKMPAFGQMLWTAREVSPGVLDDMQFGMIKQINMTEQCTQLFWVDKYDNHIASPTHWGEIAANGGLKISK